MPHSLQTLLLAYLQSGKYEIGVETKANGESDTTRRVCFFLLRLGGQDMHRLEKSFDMLFEL